MFFPDFIAGAKPDRTPLSEIMAQRDRATAYLVAARIAGSQVASQPEVVIDPALQQHETQEIRTIDKTLPRNGQPAFARESA